MRLCDIIRNTRVERDLRGFFFYYYFCSPFPSVSRRIINSRAIPPYPGGRGSIQNYYTRKMSTHTKQKNTITRDQFNIKKYVSRYKKEKLQTTAAHALATDVLTALKC